MSEKVFFGFKEVDQTLKQSLVNKVFSNVAKNYDLMNDVMSFGIHRHWKNAIISEISNLSSSIIDVAGGTGDISLKIYKEARSKQQSPYITILDINSEMLKVGRNKLIDNGIIDSINLICGNAEIMPFADNSFDYYICAFGIRNMTNLNQALSEANRILKPGGKFICLEFSHISNDFLAKIYDIYSMNMIPIFGEFIAKDKNSYKYLVESIRKFPTQHQFVELLENNHFQNISYRNLTYGVCAIHIGYKKHE